MFMHVNALLLSVHLILSLADSVACAAVVPLGSEFQVNTYTTGNQIQRAIASDADGNFIVLWDDGVFSAQGQDGSGIGVFAQRYDRTGATLGGQFQVNSYTTGRQSDAQVAMDDSGNFVVVWLSGSGQDGDGYGVFARHYDSSGAPVGGEFQVNTYTTETQTPVGVTSDATGTFLVMWEDRREDGSSLGRLRGQRYNSAGGHVGQELLMTVPTPVGSSEHGVDRNGNIVLVWHPATVAADILAQRYDSAGVPVDGVFQVNTYTTGNQIGASLAVEPDGSFVVVWAAGSGQDGDGYGAFGQRFDGTGHRRGGEFQVNTHTRDSQQSVDVAAFPDGSFIVVGSDFGAPQESVFGRFYDRIGDPVGEQFQINAYGSVSIASPLVATNGAGNFVVVWRTNQRDGDAWGVVGRRFASPPPPIPAISWRGTCAFLVALGMVVALSGLGHRRHGSATARR